MPQRRKKEVQKKAASSETRSLETTIHLHKYIRKTTFKNKAPTAIRKIREFAKRIMRTGDNRIDTKLNDFIWSHGIRNVATRVRVRLDRRVQTTEDQKATYTVISFVPVQSYKNLHAQIVDAEEE